MRFFLVCSVLFFVCGVVFGAAQKISLCSGWAKCDNLQDSEVQAAARAAVSAHNQATGEKLILLAVLSAQKQVVAGMNYQMVLKVKTEKNHPYSVEAVVWKKLDGTYSLTSFGK